MARVIPKLTQEQMDKLEALVDRNTLAGVLLALSEICDLKEEHVREGWQDKHTADTWKRSARALERMAETHAITDASY